MAVPRCRIVDSNQEEGGRRRKAAAGDTIVARGAALGLFRASYVSDFAGFLTFYLK